MHVLQNDWAYLKVAFVHKIVCLHIFSVIVVKHAFTNYERRKSA